ncbi:docking protein 6 [Pimephales promelas]|uniref:docking protein 6 n=1 Tax=Pimephales promelas TaxID=90988 RepID=UPI0019557A1C|nr:docking protein 6 [Pimephales promelas]
MDEDIRRKGTLYFHQQRFGKRWRKVWCVVVAEGRRNIARLELYEHKHSSIKQSSIKQGSAKRKPDYKQVIRLRECIRISECEMADRPKDCAAFLLETSDKLYFFASHHSEVKDWIRSLCEQAFPNIEAEQRLERESCIYDPVTVSSSNAREMKENSLYDTAESVRDFLVIAVGTEAAIQCNLYGDYFLTPLLDCLILKDVKTKEVLFKWPYCYVRKFGQDTLSFSFEAGRRCDSGEGNFEFATHQAERLFNIVSESIQNLPRPPIDKTNSLDYSEKSRVRETVATDQTYDYTIETQSSDFLPEGNMQRAVQRPSKMLNPAWRSFSLNAIEPQSESQMTRIDTNLENKEAVYATVSKAQPKATSPTDPKMHWQNLRKALHQSTSLKDAFKTNPDISQSSDFEGTREETRVTEDLTDLFGDSIQQLAINDVVRDISAEPIYAEPQDFQARAEWVAGAVWESEEVIEANQRAHDGAGHLAEDEFVYSPQAMAAPSNPMQSPDMYSTYDNLMLKGRRI